MTTIPPSFNRGMDSVRVENISESVSRREVVALFNTLIGEVRSSNASNDILGSPLEVTFFTHDSAKKALCMSGYNIGGKPLAVTSTGIASADGAPTRGKYLDNRRNLYVLGLPFSLTKAEFSSMFARYGTVSHCVILATVDTASRRRGFVVMSTHEQAKLAMISLTRTQVKGNSLDISWAVVQRSQGFLDGGDRTLMLDSRLEPASSNPKQNDTLDFNSANSSDTSIGSNEYDLAFLAPSPVPTSTLLVTNLPTFLFSQTLDFQPLFCPFGQFKKLEILGPVPSGVRTGNTTSAIVEYISLSSAKDAKESLHGQCYANYTVNAEYVGSTASTTDLAHVSDPGNQNNSGLGPFASAFAFGVPQSDVLLGPAGSYYSSRAIQPYHYASRSFFLEPQYSSLYAPHPSFSYVPMHPRIYSRSSSANSRWSAESSQYPSSQQFLSGQVHSNTHAIPSSYPTFYA